MHEKPPVIRPRQPRDKEPSPEAAVDPQAILDERVQLAIDNGARALSSVTAEVTGPLPEAERFVEAGRIAHTVAQRARVASGHERPWVPVGAMEVEEWTLTTRKPS